MIFDEVDALASRLLSFAPTKKAACFTAVSLHEILKSLDSYVGLSGTLTEASAIELVPFENDASAFYRLSPRHKTENNEF